MKPFTITCIGLAALLAPLTTPAFELGSCLVLHVSKSSEASTPKLAKVSITVDQEVFQAEVVTKPRATAHATDFITVEPSKGFGATETELGSIDTADTAFTVKATGSTFDSSPFDSSSFKLD